MKIQIGRKEYTVKYVDMFKGKTHVGEIDFDACVIYLARKGGITHRKQTRTALAHTLWHEIVHGILHDMKHPLNHNEKFVDALAKRIRLVVKQIKEKDHDELDLVPQRAERLRKLRKEVSRGSRTQKVQARKH